jgi:uncharacterized damage-inducible protein DinB
MRSTLLSLFDAEVARTAAVLQVLPDESLHWTPDPRSFTLGRLAMHVATLPGWMNAFTTREGYDMGPGGPGPRQPDTLDAVLIAFADASARGRHVLEHCTAADLHAPWTLSRNGAAVSTLTRAEAIATFGLHHLVHHRGQLTVYLRLLGRPVPPIYGDSADAPLLPATAMDRPPPSTS